MEWLRCNVKTDKGYSAFVRYWKRRNFAGQGVENRKVRLQCFGGEKKRYWNS